MKIRFLPLLSLALLAGCTSAPLPEGYKGPLAKIHDTAMPVSSSEIYFCRLTEVDGRRVVAGADRDVPAQPCLLSIEGVDHDAFDILGFIFGMQRVHGDIVATLEGGEEYFVKGQLLKSDSGVYLVVWLEDGAGRHVSVQIHKFISAPPAPTGEFPPIEDWDVAARSYSNFDRPDPNIGNK